ncbi:DUF92 domain-containing protein [Salipaludibacillus daqingensis]|uniref:DUF92 domain-containing protein n=1 Tax=Salipaludibacillus daqingensis TaxID=3041001 RepID=UPI002476089B|nr:DUF92 domain-containing protein [Salipaludibacillus daqingensis]
MDLNQQFIWLLGVTILAFLSYRKKALTGSGAIASFVVGALITFAFSLHGLLLLAAFFLSSTVLGRLLQRKDENEESFEEKGEKRDAKQVLANGGWAAFASLFFLFVNHPLWYIAFVASLAAVNSDTWASSIGKRSKTPPKMIITGEVVSIGQSGGTTLLGNLGAIAGSMFIVLTAMSFQFLSPVDGIPWWTWLIIVAIGFVSQWIDALAGALFQALNYCGVCDAYTEKKNHCHQRTKTIKGKQWIDNDVVNHLCSFSAFLMGAIVGIFLYF